MLNEKLLRTLGLCLLLQLYSPLGYAGVESFEVDSSHTYPSFAADHMGGLSLWRGKINKTSGVAKYDETAQVGAVDILMDMDSIDFGFHDMNKHAKSDDMLDCIQPRATQGTLYLRLKRIHLRADDSGKA